MKAKSHLLKYFIKQGGKRFVRFPDGAFCNPSSFPFAAIETSGAVLFADLPGYSKLSEKFTPVECTYFVNHFFAWFEGEALKQFGGLIDKFIGDEVMIIFPHTECMFPPLESAILTAKAMLENDPFAFSPKIGIASGIFAVSIVGTTETYDITAIGHTVNLAARCAGEVKKSNSVRVATEDLNVIKKTFNDYNYWNISSPIEIEPKNMKKVKVIDIERKTIWIPNFNYEQKVKDNVRVARKSGVIINNLEASS